MSQKPLTEQPIYVTRPLLPDARTFSEHLEMVWSSRWLTNYGEQHRLLQERLCHVLKVPSLCLFNNGMTALLVAVQSLGLSGDVVTTPFTFAATPHALAWNGITPVFCDIDPETLTIDPDKIERLITPKTTAILGVHVFGVPCAVEAIQSVADRRGLKVVYDAAHAFGTEMGGVGIGNWGDITMFSFHATKLFHTGEGGALCARDPEVKSRIELLRNFGIKSEDEVVLPGINGKMNEIQAALGLAVLRNVDEERSKRQEILQRYKRNLAGLPGVQFPPASGVTAHSFQYLVLRIDEGLFGHPRDWVHERLREHNIFTRRYFYPLCSNFACYERLPSASRDNLPVANRAAEEVLAMPFYGELGMDAVDRICSILFDLKEER